MSPSRRRFVLGAGGALLALAGRSGKSQQRGDLLIRGGTVFDGSGAPGFEADVAISGGRLTAIGRGLAVQPSIEIDARGLAVAPGFIDIHSHADGTLFEDPRVESVIRQGITTVVVGQDGSSRAPRRQSEDPTERRFDSLSEFFAAVEKLPSSVNLASMVGLGTIRGAVVGNVDRPAKPEEIEQMVALVRRALDQGACGASSGLEYTPGAFASLEELVALCRPLAERRLPHATHMRNEDDRLLESIDEAIAVAGGSGCPLQISHLKTQGPRNWGKIEAALARIEAAHREGLDVAFDRYPYVAYQTGLTNLFPVWSRDGGSEAFLARLADPAVAPRIRSEVLAKVDLIGGWDNVMIASVRAEPDKPAEGQRLGAYASALRSDPYEFAVSLLKRSGGDVAMVGFAMSEENIDRFLAHPLGMVASDGGAFAVEGPARRGHPHPRSLGTFPRALGRFVRERKALALAEAIRDMTAFPASRLRLTDRGRLAPGAAADVVVFDPATIADRATFAEPFQYSAGIKAVLVNGAIALEDGERGPTRTGRVLRSTSTPTA